MKVTNVFECLVFLATPDFLENTNGVPFLCSSNLHALKEEKIQTSGLFLPLRMANCFLYVSDFS